MAAELDAHDAALQTTFDHSHTELDKIRTNSESREWLGPNLDSAEGTQKIYSMLQKVVESPQFLEKISNMCHCGAGCGHGQGCCHKDGMHSHTHGEVLRSDWWEVKEDGRLEEKGTTDDVEGEGLTSASPESACTTENAASQDLDDYVMIEREDVIEALAVFVARYVVALPEAQDMEPKMLQRAVSNAFLELRMNRIRRLWSWGKYLYRCAALGYSAFSMYQHPWIVAAVLRAMYTSSKFIVGSMVAIA